MQLSKVIESIQVKSVVGSLETDITSVCYDSRKVVEGSLFCALTGTAADGHDFIPTAIENGASAILAENPYPAESDVPWLQVHDSRAAMAKASSALFSHPSREMPVVGVTGTNGKTTTALLIHFLMEAALRRAGVIGTVSYQIADQILDSPHTTPESPDLQALLRQMRDADCRAAVMEVSSHGLAQHRVGDIPFKSGVFTNLTQDHLDYHKTMEAYFEAKCLMFDQMNAFGGGSMIVNRDDQYGDRLLKKHYSNIEKISFGNGVGCDYQIAGIKSDFNGTTFQLRMKGRQLLVKIPLIGRFNVYNATAALASARSIGLNLREAVANIESAPQVPGRLELVGERQTNYRAYVDYAHTPDALENAIKTLRDLEPNKLITVFGCGGNRDANKRPLMGGAASKMSDIAILTSDNPRDEDPQQIFDDTTAGMVGTYETIPHRRDAIEQAINLAGERDIVLIAGKGHETYQEIKGVKHDFDDRLVARQCIAAKSEAY